MHIMEFSNHYMQCMKKVILFLIAFLVVMSSYAQQEHLQFMGIPIDGTISSFTKQLKKKGFVKDKLYNIVEDSISGYRIFKGSFAGENNVNVVVFYDEKTKLVNNVKVYIKCYSEKEVNKKYESFLSNIKSKYSASIVRERLLEEESGKEFVIKNTENVIIGLILLYKGQDNDNYNLSLEYTDFNNVMFLTKKEIEDL